MYRFIFFDLDGTLTDSSEGAFKCLDYAMEKLGEPPIPVETKKLFIGPPMTESFPALLAFPGRRNAGRTPFLPGAVRRLRAEGGSRHSRYG